MNYDEFFHSSSFHNESVIIELISATLVESSSEIECEDNWILRDVAEHWEASNSIRIMVCLIVFFRVRTVGLNSFLEMKKIPSKMILLF